MTGRPGPWCAPLALLALWSAAAWSPWPGDLAVPSPRAVAAVALAELPRQAIWLDAGATLARVLAGVAVATLAGAALGLALGASSRAWRAAEPAVDFVRAVPPILTFPMFLLALGYGERARVAAVAAGAVGIVLLHVATAVAHAPRARADAVRLAGLRGARAFLHLHVFEALPALFTGVRLALAAGLVVAVVSEMLVGARHGLGTRALAAQLAYQPDRLWFVILVAGALGAALSGAVARLERRVVHWRGC